ncbi:MAG: VanZ family protein [Oscillospiraceae bacterium]|nr:VanZ family protein [Oscillospiraceae bacterium]
MIIGRTLFCREYEAHPLRLVMQGWQLRNSDNVADSQSIENILLFIPFTLIGLYAFGNRIFQSRKRGLLMIMGISAVTSFGASLFIELCQIIFKCGTFQVSDLIFNTSGGVIGGILYWFVSKLHHRQKKASACVIQT